MSHIRIPTRAPDDWKALLASPSHWAEDHSALAAAQSWEAAQSSPATGHLPPEIAALMGPGATLLLALPEYRTPLPGGSRASQTDIFALLRLGAQTCALAVEAKVRESFGPTLGGWQKTPSAGKTERLDHLCACLGLTDPPPPDLRYQLVHRAGSAVIEARRFKTDLAAMVVQSFTKDDLWFQDFAAFCTLFGITAQTNTAHRVTLPDGLPLILGWATGDRRFLQDLSA